MTHLRHKVWFVENAMRRQRGGKGERGKGRKKLSSKSLKQRLSPPAPLPQKQSPYGQSCPPAHTPCSSFTLGEL